MNSRILTNIMLIAIAICLVVWLIMPSYQINHSEGLILRLNTKTGKVQYRIITEDKWLPLPVE